MTTSHMNLGPAHLPIEVGVPVFVYFGVVCMGRVIFVDTIVASGSRRDSVPA